MDEVLKCGWGSLYKKIMGGAQVVKRAKQLVNPIGQAQPYP